MSGQSHRVTSGQGRRGEEEEGKEEEEEEGNEEKNKARKKTRKKGESNNNYCTGYTTTKRHVPQTHHFRPRSRRGPQRCGWRS